MRLTVIALVALVVCVFSAPGMAQSSAAGAPAEPSVGIVGQVTLPAELESFSGSKAWRINGQEVTAAEIEQLTGVYYGPFVLQDYVGEMLLRQEAARKNIVVTEGDVQKTETALRDELGTRSEQAFQSYLRAKHATPQWFHDKARAYTYMKKVLSDQVYINDREVETFYTRNQATYRRNESVQYRIMSFRERAGAETALAEIKKGKSFQEVAKSYAADAQERALAGEIQFYEKGQPTLPPDLATALLAAPVNQVAGPVQALGWQHLIRVEKKTDPHQFSLDEVRGIIRGQLSQQKLEQKVWPEWISAQLQAAKIEVVKGP